MLRSFTSCCAKSHGDLPHLMLSMPMYKHEANNKTVLDYLSTYHNAASPPNYPPRRARRLDTVVLAAFSSLASCSLPVSVMTHDNNPLVFQRHEVSLDLAHGLSDTDSTPTKKKSQAHLSLTSQHTQGNSEPTIHSTTTDPVPSSSNPQPTHRELHHAYQASAPRSKQCQVQQSSEQSARMLRLHVTQAPLSCLGALHLLWNLLLRMCDFRRGRCGGIMGWLAG